MSAKLIKIPLRRFKANRALRGDVFLALPLNKKNLRLAFSGDELTPVVLDRLASKGHEFLSVIWDESQGSDPENYPIFAGDQSNATASGDTPKEESAFSPDGNGPNTDKSFQSGHLIEKGQALSAEDSNKETTKNFSTENSTEEASRSISGDEPEGESSQKFSRGKEGVESTQSFSRDAEEAESTQKFSRDKELDSIQSFSRDKEQPEEVFTFSATIEENPEAPSLRLQKRFRATKNPDDPSTPVSLDRAEVKKEARAALLAGKISEKISAVAHQASDAAALRELERLTETLKEAERGVVTEELFAEFLTDAEEESLNQIIETGSDEEMAQKITAHLEQGTNARIGLAKDLEQVSEQAKKWKHKQAEALQEKRFSTDQAEEEEINSFSQETVAEEEEQRFSRDADSPEEERRFSSSSEEEDEPTFRFSNTLEEETDSPAVRIKAQSDALKAGKPLNRPRLVIDAKQAFLSRKVADQIIKLSNQLENGEALDEIERLLGIMKAIDTGTELPPATVDQFCSPNEFSAIESMIQNEAEEKVLQTLGLLTEASAKSRNAVRDVVRAIENQTVTLVRSRSFASLHVSVSRLAAYLGYALGYTDLKFLSELSLAAILHFKTKEGVSLEGQPQGPFVKLLLDEADTNDGVVEDGKRVIHFLDVYANDPDCDWGEKDFVRKTFDRAIKTFHDGGGPADSWSPAKWSTLVKEPISMDVYSLCNKASANALKEMKSGQ